MAVEQQSTHTQQHSSGHHTEATAPTAHKPDTPAAWAKKHKALAALGGGGIVLLLVSHKGNKAANPGSATDAAAAAVANQQALDNALANTAGSSIPTSSPGDGGFGASTSSAPSTDPTAGTVADPTVGTQPTDPNQFGPNQLGPIEITIPGSPDPVPAPAGSASAPTPKQKHEKGVKKEHGSGGTKKTGGVRTIPKTASGSKGGHGTTVHNRHFPGAKGSHVGAPHKSADGVMHHPVAIDHGGHTTHHISHNNGTSWTDNPPGKSPPSRGAPKSVKGTGSKPAPHVPPASSRQPAPAKRAPVHVVARKPPPPPPHKPARRR